MYGKKVKRGIALKKIGFVTGFRAEYGIVRRYLEYLNNDNDIDLQLIVTGALLDEKYGHQVDLIYKDGFNVAEEIEVKVDSTSNENVLFSMADTLKKFAVHFANNKYDLLIILGDRYEMLSVATAAAMQRVPILHLHGGEATYGNYDEFIRHSITKMSLYHFTATEEYRQRVIQLGEMPDKVFYLGALGAENCLYIDEENVEEEVKKLPNKKYFVILFHPETLTNVDTLTQTKELLKAINGFKEYMFVFIGTNVDTNSDVIRRSVKDFVDNSENAVYFENLHTDGYHHLLKNSICLIGNSSSGLIEAPSLGIYTINIGARQDGRVKGNSVIDVKCESGEIAKVVGKVIEINDSVKPVNPYYKKDSALNYYKTTKTLLDRVDNDRDEPKKFYDL